MKTLNLPELMDFTEALKCMLDGKCLGIRPDDGNNLRYMELWRPRWQRADWQIRWKGSEENDGGIRSSQYLGKWCLVVADHRQFLETAPSPKNPPP